MPLLIIALIGLVVVHGYLWLRLVRDTTRPGRLRRYGTWLLGFLALLAPLTMVITRTTGPSISRPFAWLGYPWIGLLFYLVIFFLLLEVPRALIEWRLRRTTAPTTARTTTQASSNPSGQTAPDDPVDAAPNGQPDTAATPPVPTPDSEPEQQTSTPQTLTPQTPATPTPDNSDLLLSRRLVLARSVALLAAAATVGTVGYGVRTALGEPTIKQVTVPLRRLNRRMSGFRIAVVSDIHLGPFIGRGFAERVVTLVNRQQPDLVAIVGDLVDGPVAELGQAATPLRDLTARHGAYFVTGNHEYYSGADEWLDQIRELGVRPLVNQRVEINQGAVTLDVAGVNDAEAERFGGEEPDYDAALGDRDPTRPVVLLAHQPVQVHRAAEYGVDLQLSGHTHGGQLFPFHLMVRLQQPTLSGLTKFDDTWLYVTNGAGFFGPPIRVGAPPDITIVRLVS